MKKRTLLMILMLTALLLAGCSSKPTDTASTAKTASSAGADAVITLSGDTANCDADTVSIDGSVITITGAGTY